MMVCVTSGVNHASVIYSGEPLDAAIPTVDLARFALARADELGERPALVDGASGRVLSYRELARQVRSFAAGLGARGFGPGDTFAIFMPNAPEYPVAFYGAIAAGGRCTTVNPLYTARELEFQLADSGASMLLTAPAFADVAREAVRAVRCELFVLGGAEGANPYDDLLGDPEEAPEPAIDSGTDVAALPYSSGTTGFPKGVMLTHRNIVANVLQADVPMRFSEGEVIVAVLPFFHIYGLVVVLTLGLRSGATLVTMPRFDLAQYLELSERYRATRAYVVPPIALALANDPSVANHDLSSLRTICSGAAPLGPELEEKCSSRIGCPLVQAYGMTELSPVSHSTPFAGPGRRGTVGRLVPGTEARLVDPLTGEDLQPGERGEVWIRGPQVMHGYLNNPEATAEMIDSDGWLRTGDVAVVDDEGWFTIVDRVKELIKYKGFQVAPAELEAVLGTHPAVADCAVIGIPDDEAGELPKAFVVPASQGIDAHELIEFVAGQVSPQKRIREIELIDKIPKSPSGKILRRLLRDRTSAAGG